MRKAVALIVVLLLMALGVLWWTGRQSARLPGWYLEAKEAGTLETDLRAAADIQPDPTEEIALLETRGYRGGWIRAFRNDGNDVAVPRSTNSTIRPRPSSTWRTA